MKPPLLSGNEIVHIFLRLGYSKTGQKGSHIKVYNPAKKITLIIPNHKEVDRWTLKAILKDAKIPAEEFLKVIK